MKRFAILLLLLLFDTFLYVLSEDDKIVGGTTVTARIKYMASLRIGDQHSCGGCILNNLWIATAAHCLPDINRVYVGSNSLIAGTNPYLIIKKIQHPSYRDGALGYDAAVVKIDRPMVFNDLVGPIELPTRDVRISEMLYATGWGRLSRDGPIPNDLQELYVKPLFQIICAIKLLEPFLPDTVLCTLNSRGHGMCSGDSGGPLVNGNVLYGIVNAVIPCALGYPDIQLRVFKVKQWIKDTIDQN